ncbi:MAG: hypothetical protein ACLUTA_12200 [Blautia wexlerae]
MATVNLAIGRGNSSCRCKPFRSNQHQDQKGLEVTLQEISRAVVPMIAACVAVLLIVTYIPITSTFLPKALAKKAPTQVISPPLPLTQLPRRQETAITPLTQSQITATLTGRK